MNTLAAHVISLLIMLNILVTVLFTPLGEKIRMDYSNDINPFETWALQQYYKFCFHSKVTCNVGLDLKPKILRKMAMILSSDKLNWSQGIGGWLINLQPDPENILYRLLFLLETHVTSLSVNTTGCLVYLNCMFGSDFLPVMINTHLSTTIGLDKDKKGVLFCFVFHAL